jgi:predicted nucleic acid-binding protein
MLLYVETNFILELAYVQEESAECQQLLSWAETGELALVVPAFCAIEARMSWQGNVKRRNRLLSDVRSELRQLSRSRPLAEITEDSKAFVASLIDTAQTDRTRLETAVATVLRCGQVIPVTPAIVQVALLYETELGLSAQDATVYASVVRHVSRAERAEDKVFVTTNSNDFAVPNIEDELARSNCKLLTRFAAAEGFVRSRLNRSTG